MYIAHRGRFFLLGSSSTGLAYWPGSRGDLRRVTKKKSVLISSMMCHLALWETFLIP